jgi:hypothetical protein
MKVLHTVSSLIENPVSTLTLQLSQKKPPTSKLPVVVFILDFS